MHARRTGGGQEKREGKREGYKDVEETRAGGEGEEIIREQYHRGKRDKRGERGETVT